MMILKEICGLIPSYNEARTIGSIVNELKAKGLVAYVVDDGSGDETASVAESCGAIVLRHKMNLGKGASLREGFKRVLKDGFRLVLVMDGDGQHSARDTDRFIEKMHQTNADIVIGNRMSDVASMPYIRILTNRAMSKILSWMSGQDIPDSQCGFRLIKKEVLDAVELESSKYEIDSELILQAAKKGFRIESVPVETVYKDESSRINPVLDTMRFIAFIVKTIAKG